MGGETLSQEHAPVGGDGKAVIREAGSQEPARPERARTRRRGPRGGREGPNRSTYEPQGTLAACGSCRGGTRRVRQAPMRSWTDTPSLFTIDAPPSAVKCRDVDERMMQSRNASNQVQTPPQQSEPLRSPLGQWVEHGRCCARSSRIRPPPQEVGQRPRPRSMPRSSTRVTARTAMPTGMATFGGSSRRAVLRLIRPMPRMAVSMAFCAPREACW